LPHDVDRITSKRRFAVLADELQLPITGTVFPDDSAELHEAAAADKEELRSRDEELVRVDRALVIQEMVLGPDENHVDYHALVDGAGKLRGEFAGKKLRVSIDPSEVSQIGRFVLERLGFRGMANMNFKRDDRDGRLYLLELNPRFSNWTGVDIACGIDFAVLYYMACIGTPYDAPSRYGLGKRWLNFAADRESMKVYARKGTRGWPRWAWSIARSSSWSLYAPTDPGPADVHLRRTDRRRIGGLFSPGLR
jgi:predicted ATP-grasp superfamily ATP-dependent carboligase